MVHAAGSPCRIVDSTSSRHLAAVGFDAMPALFGCDISEGQVAGDRFEHIAGAEDGWTWLFERVNAVDDGTMPRA